MEIKEHLKIKASAEAIFKAVATQEGIQGWWSKDSIVGEQEGHRSLLKFDKNKDGKITEMLFRTETLIPHKKIVWECIDNGNPAWIGTKITIEVTGTNNESEVIFSHSNFDQKWKGMDPFEMTKQGWVGHFIPSFVSFCEKGEGQAW